MFLSADLITGALSFLFTILIFSYVLGDNPLFRMAIYIFTGASAGYIAAIAFWQILWPRLIAPFLFGAPPMELALLSVPMVGSVLVLMKISPRLAGFSRIVMAFLVGIGAAVAISGAVSGTLLPQTMSVINAMDVRASQFPAEAIFNGAFVLTGTVLSLAYFQFGARRRPDGAVKRNGIVELLAFGGRIFIGITLGVVFAGVFAAALTALIERMSSLVLFIGKFL